MNGLTDKDAFKSAVRQSRRNLPFFAVSAIVVSLLPDLLGVAGSIIAAISAISFLAFAGQALLSTMLGLFSLVTWPFQPESERRLTQPAWVSAATLLTAFDAAVYLGCIYFVGKSARWWGLF